MRSNTDRDPSLDVRLITDYHPGVVPTVDNEGSNLLALYVNGKRVGTTRGDSGSKSVAVRQFESVVETLTLYNVDAEVVLYDAGVPGAPMVVRRTKLERS